MIEAILSLVFSVHSNPGIYALLLGSGVSRPAGISTGWEIVLDIINKIAKLNNEKCDPNPVAWYKNKFREDPDYSKILNVIAKSPSERSQLLRRYFEPNEEEREQGLKMPTVAHKAIASLVANGYIRIIITTNFDRLLEEALENIGIVPTVISTKDAVKGALPITHTECTIIKVHGDYLDTRIKNIPAELEKYDVHLNKLLDQIFDEFGLIICGWSAEWDTALRAALERCKTHRFTTFWATRSEPKKIAMRLIKLRQAEVIRIQDANSFFTELEQKVSALSDLDKPHPLSAKIAVAMLRKYLPDDKYRIQLDGLLMQEANKVYKELSSESFSMNAAFNVEEYRNRVQSYESITEILRHLFITGCYYGGKNHEELWVRCLERVIVPLEVRSGFPHWIGLRRYPALLLIYAGGISSLVAGSYNNFATLLTKPEEFHLDKNLPLILSLAPNKVMKEDLAKRMFQTERAGNTPVNNHLEQVLREPFREYLPDDEQYRRFFDRFEYLFALVYVDLFEKKKNRIWGPVGCFRWRNRDEPERYIMTEIEQESTEEGDNWPPIKAGLFDGSVERFQHIKKEFDNLFRQLPYF